MCTGDFPHLESASLHPNQQEMADWHQRFAEHFELLPYVHFQTLVSDVHLLESGRYEVIFVKPDSPAPQKMLVDKVFLATGLHRDPFVPQVPGIEKFDGVAIHSQAFKS
jgi:cation diffusion facilitator CzcD-associated flavoprotein CzcO